MFFVHDALFVNIILLYLSFRLQRHPLKALLLSTNVLNIWRAYLQFIHAKLLTHCVTINMHTKQSSKHWQVLSLEAKLPGGLRQQVLVSGQVLAIPGELESM